MERPCRRCTLYRLTESAENLYDGAGLCSMCFPTLSSSLRLQVDPKLTHTRVPRKALACCLGAMAATFISNGAYARALAMQPAVLPFRHVRSGMTERFRARSTWAANMGSHRGYA
jgi:hypothetical protein